MAQIKSRISDLNDLYFLRRLLESLLKSEVVSLGLPQFTKDMSTAVKCNSLEGRPLSKRLVLGGTFQINHDPTSLDLSPLLGYRINNKYTLGIGATYRAVLDFENYQTKDQVYGYRGFFQADAVKGFFLHGEYERMNAAVETSGTGATALTD